MNYQESRKPYLSRSMLHSWQRHGQRWVYHDKNRHRLNNFGAWPYLPGVLLVSRSQSVPATPSETPRRQYRVEELQLVPQTADLLVQVLDLVLFHPEEDLRRQTPSLRTSRCTCALRLDAPNSTNASFFSSVQTWHQCSQISQMAIAASFHRCAVAHSCSVR